MARAHNGSRINFFFLCVCVIGAAFEKWLKPEKKEYKSEEIRMTRINVATENETLNSKNLVSIVRSTSFYFAIVCVVDRNNTKNVSNFPENKVLISFLEGYFTR